MNDSARSLARRLIGGVPPISTLRRQRDAHAFRADGAEKQLAELREHRNSEGGTFPRLVPDGHFYSPIPDLEVVRKDDARIFASRESVPGVDLRLDHQLELARQLAEHVENQPFDVPTKGVRYYADNAYFNFDDALILHGMLRLLRPKRLIEVGSGFSSAVILDTNERFLDRGISCTFIDPFADRLRSLLRPTDQTQATVLEERVQDVDTTQFSLLEAGDVLFIDSSHVSKVGSDVNFLLLDIVPRLPPGVHVHVHDIVWPFEYGRHWIYEGRAWNEAYLLRALLINNDHLLINWFGHYWYEHPEPIRKLIPAWRRSGGVSLWMQTA
ncbi:MAG: class I SAM-dependent methyltransferase [Actinobacteria bacterium]|nr:class I SAM-dependent methyltransferase [Actinomycetota bacterium]